MAEDALRASPSRENRLAIVNSMMQHGHSAQPSLGAVDWIGIVANAITIAVGVAAVLVFCFGGRFRSTVIAFHRWRALRGLSRTVASRMGRLLLRAPFRASAGEASPSTIGYLGLLDQSGTDGVTDLSWSREVVLADASSALLEFSERLASSVLCKVGSATRAEAHEGAAREAAELLGADAAYEPILRRNATDATSSSVLSLLTGATVTVLAGPRWAGAAPEFATGDRTTFDSVRVSETRSGPIYGVDGTVAEIARGEARIHLSPQIPTEKVVEVGDRAKTIAEGDLARGSDTYNGYFPRLLSWRVETGARQTARRLHLLTSETTFFTWRVLNQATDRVSMPQQPFVALRGDASSSVGAVHLPILVSMFTSDGFLILRRRAPGALFAAGRIESAANGNPEIRAAIGSHCDRDEVGMLRLEEAAVRELREEMGPVHTGPLRPSLLAVLDSDEEVGSPYLGFETTSTMTLEQIRLQFQLADPTEGFHESGSTRGRGECGF